MDSLNDEGLLPTLKYLIAGHQTTTYMEDGAYCYSTFCFYRDI